MILPFFGVIINICNEGGLVYGSCIVFRITLNDS
jgi:hypothetical protein